MTKKGCCWRLYVFWCWFPDQSSHVAVDFLPIFDSLSPILHALFVLEDPSSPPKIWHATQIKTVWISLPHQFEFFREITGFSMESGFRVSMGFCESRLLCFVPYLMIMKWGVFYEFWMMSKREDLLIEEWFLIF